MAGVAGRSGRKPTREKYASAINKAERRICDRLPDLIDYLFDLAEGAWVEELTADGVRRVYKQRPDFKAASYLTDRVMGKPVQAVENEISGPGGTPIEFCEVSGYDVVKPGGSE